MSSEEASRKNALNRFISLSSGLTGYEENALWGTGQAELYFDTLCNEVNTATVDDLLHSDPDKAIHNERLQPIARAVIKLWYLGQWCVGQQRPDEAAFSLSPPAYTQALAWQAMGGHPQGARQQGYASWAKPPTNIEVDE